jgi:hypothetical protein
LSTDTPKTGTSVESGTFSFSSFFSYQLSCARGITLGLRRDSGFSLFHLEPLLLSDGGDGMA